MQIEPAIPACISALAGEHGILVRVIKNPTQPGFNHYLFESVAALVKQGCAKDPRKVDMLEEMLIPPFNYVLSQDVQVTRQLRMSCVQICCCNASTSSAEFLSTKLLASMYGGYREVVDLHYLCNDKVLLQEFHPYVFQIFAQLIELHPTQLPAFYMASLFQPLLAPVFWERAGNVPALTRLMQVFIIALCMRSSTWSQESVSHFVYILIPAFPILSAAVQAAVIL